MHAAPLLLASSPGPGYGPENKPRVANYLCIQCIQSNIYKYLPYTDNAADTITIGMRTYTSKVTRLWQVVSKGQARKVA